MTGLEIGVIPFADGGRRQKPRNAGGFQKLEKGRKQLLS